ncbi:hypothetical protein LOB99_06650 [Lactobacillus delbrueckii subsp. lactis]|uniref:hypothetical protein n=1 Tax=Lactobacillus delbrueckii TaxID=1584 RepID=UPI001E5D5745|nr:hypothetical protein [Lactobacillus delbrueckii]MCD5442549.1 hypothetical protein [Lactobacillus delbrueckii subsp. lactis]
MDTLFYLVADTLLAAYAGYSWYSQATVILRARWRMTAVVMPILLVWLGASWGYLDLASSSS